jgi:Protein of unknown function (DUF3365).
MEPVRSTGSHGLAFILLVLVMLAGLPVAVWLDLRNLSETALLRQAKDLNSVVSSVRGYYASNVVGRVLASPGETKVVHNYESIPGAIPIPATLSLELGRVISEQQENISYRFVSDFPFKNRAPHVLDGFETGALADLRNHVNQQLTDVSASVFSDRVRLVAPVIMGAACVACHNSHPESPKRDWKSAMSAASRKLLLPNRSRPTCFHSNICWLISSSWPLPESLLSVCRGARQRLFAA